MKSAKRLWAILTIVRRYGLADLLPQDSGLGWLRWILGRVAVDERFAHLPIETRTRLALEALGPIFVKFGQTLSTRPDLLPETWLHELSQLQDRVTPFASKEAETIIQSALGKPMSELFAHFEPQALASASIAQVHAAELFDGKAVVVKVLRPEVKKQVKQDIELLYAIAKIAQWGKQSRRLRPVEVVREFEQTLENELDFMSEAANASQLRANFKTSNLLYVPEIYWEYTRPNVMVMERVFAVNIADSKALSEAKTNMKELAERGVEIFFTQVFRDSFFHADMHPGNIFVDLANPQKPQYCAIDFGIMGSLTPEDQHYLAENFLAFFNRDYRRVAELHIESGWVPSDTRVTDFEAAIRKVSEPIFGKPIKDISFGAFLLSLFQTARRFNMHIQPQLVLLQKTFFNVEGLGRRLYPELDLWTTAKPVLEDWMKTQIGPRAFAKRMRSHAHDYAKVLPQLPILTAKALQLYTEQHKNRPKDQSALGAVLLLGSLALSVLGNPQSALSYLGLLVTGGLGLYYILRSNR
ncbi:MAG: ubiquinone biosynthesis regulatory protein kinase UbiB [Cardiobacteriaceae bacterium]|nr:ubiquinone biosynthesis regulatory protein kinase UbiB [Cardiobacteriaceae bacterium]